MKKIIVIGGGAAGMMAATMVAGQAKCAVSLFEKNAYLGAKVLISGGGRCNVTTGIFDVKELLKNYPRGAKFLMTAMFRFPPEKVMEWFSERGVPLKIEKDLRVFPVSDNGKDIVSALEKNLRGNGVEIFCNTAIAKIEKNGKQFTVTSKDGRTFISDVIILTTGGSAFRHTGSTGDGYAFAEALGHTITPIKPSLNSLVIAEKWAGALAGVSFEKAKLKMGVYERTGAFVFTHRGVSGPAVFALSSLAVHEPISAKKPLQLTIDFFPDEKLEILERRILNLIQKNPQKSMANFLDILLPKSLCKIVTELLNIKDVMKPTTSLRRQYQTSSSFACPPSAMGFMRAHGASAQRGDESGFAGSEPKRAYQIKAGALTKENRHALTRLLKEFPVTVVDRTPGEEFVTAGGVDLSQINTNTMGSKICPGLYFAGEILDVDGFTGGFNLQAAWATGALAGRSAAQ